MDHAIHVASNPPVLRGYRGSGVLLHVTSLPSVYGIGDLGPSAFTWLNRLHDAGQSWWQALPLGPTGYYNSPYQSLSSFAGNGLLLSPEFLIQDRLLTADDCGCSFSSLSVDYDAVVPFKHQLIGAAWTRFRAGVRKDLKPAYEDFCHQRTAWLEDYALFRALKVRYKGAPYWEWPDDLVQRLPSAIGEARRSLALEMDQIRLAQFLLFRQATRLKSYAREKGVRIIGDLPFFVSPDSSDVWANPELFLLDDRSRPLFVGGVPPDCFSETGQLWGNPLYDWAVHRSTGYAWCIERFRALLAHVDMIRLDHFRAFAAAWHVPAGEPTAERGEWVRGPGADFFATVREQLGGLPFVAEDLGFITEDVCRLRDDFNIPGTRVLQFAFEGGRKNPHLPENYSPNTVVYTATHDTAPTREWYDHLPKRQRQSFWKYLRRPESDARFVTPEMIRLAWSSSAAMAIAPLQDVLNLGAEGRMNVPGRAEGNWRWRAAEHMLNAGCFSWLAELTSRCNRVACAPVSAAGTSL